MRLFMFLLLLTPTIGPAAAAVLYTHPGTLLANDNGLGTPLPGWSLRRDDASADTLYFRFIVRPDGDVLTEPYLAGLQLFADSTTPGLGVGNAMLSQAYSVFAPALGELELASATPDFGLPTQSVRQGDVLTIVVRVRYVPGALDSVTVWLAPDSTRYAGSQPLALTTRFEADASFLEVHVREEQGGAGWAFSNIAVSTRMSEVFGPADFADVTSAVLADASPGAGVSWGDYDDDGDLDLCLANGLSMSHLFRNDGGGLFVEDTAAPLADFENADAMTWGDYDNDGDLDVYVAQYGIPNHLLRNDGHDTFTDVTNGVLGDAGATTSAVWGDFDNDGHLDLYLTDFDGANKLLRNQADGTFSDVTAGPLVGLGASNSAAWGDYDDDGDLDLYVANFHRPNQLLRNEGNGVFVDATTGPLGDNGYSFGVAWGDFDNDGDLDLVLVNDGESSKLFQNDGQGAFSDVTSGALAAPGAGISIACADVENDGDLDLYVTRYGEPNQLLRNDGAGVFSDASGSVLADSAFSTGAAWGDYDGDGDLDLYVANDGDPNHLLRNDQSGGNHWLQVKLHGTQSNRAAIGARVKLVAGGVTRIRELSGGSGYGSQDALVAAFGLGMTQQVDSLVIRWPSGIVQWLLPPPAVDQLIAVTEAPMALGVGDDRTHPGRMVLAPAFPNPFRTSARIAYDLPRAARVKLTVHDVQGRRVVTLAEGQQAPGRHITSWSGLDGAGHDAQAGCYWVRLSTTNARGSEMQVVKLTLAR
jgi:hypothetical protein